MVIEMSGIQIRSDFNQFIAHEKLEKLDRKSPTNTSMFGN